MAGYLRTHETLPFSRTEAHREHHARSDLHRQTSNLAVFVLTRPRTLCVRHGRSENKIALWRSLLCPKKLSSAVSGEQKTFRRLRVY